MKNSIFLILSIATPLLFIIPPARAELFVNPPARAIGAPLGGIDMQEACKEMRSSRTQTATAVMNDRKDASSWKCQIDGKGYRVYKPFNLNAVCKEQYTSRNAYAKASDRKDAYSWKCYEAARN